MINSIKGVIPSWYKYIIRDLNSYISGYKENEKKYKNISSKKKIYFLGSAHYNNLGDQAISFATLKFIEDNFREYEIIEVRLNEFLSNLRCLKKYINESDIIVLQGGGNMGYMYADAEDNRRTIIHYFKNNKIVIFPQTIDYGKDKKSKIEFEKSKKIYSKHKNLTLLAREINSYNIMKSSYRNNDIILVPDIVTYLNESNNNNNNRNGILLCLRDDEEKNISKEEKVKILNICKKYSGNIRFTDTISKNNNISYENRKNELELKFNEFKSAELIITDRLHGMIFCAITGTPCIVLDNSNHKVKGVYKWLSNLKYIKFMGDINNIDLHIKNMINLKFYNYDNTYLKKEFDLIAEAIEK